MFDLVLRGGQVLGKGKRDIAIKNGRIACLEPALLDTLSPEKDISGSLVIPSFVDSHTHLEKALTLCEAEPEGLMEAVAISAEYQKGAPPEAVAEDMLKRARTVLYWEIAAGSGVVKDHVTLSGTQGDAYLQAHRVLRREFAEKIDLLNVVSAEPDLWELWEEAAQKGWIDFIGGYPSVKENPKEEVNRLFRLAEKYGLPLDLHVDESDVPNADCFAYIAEKTLEYGMQGRVNCSHVTALELLKEDAALRLAEKTAQAQINLITLPSCNMYLMGRGLPGPVRRGVPPVALLQKAGVNVAFASDNIRDPFRPFGNGDMLEEAQFTAQVLQYGTTQKMEQVLQMGTGNAAQNALVKGYGLEAGCKADLAVLQAEGAREAIVGVVTRTLVLKKGKTVAQNGVYVC